ncbi:hypothetical protein ACKWTF_003704 [Chironomus riparius]
MKAPKTIIYLVSLYCIISGIIFVGISVLSICAYACAFDFTKSPFTYLMYLLYFRRKTCHNTIQWETLGIEQLSVERLDMPPETAAVLRTFTFSIFYLVLNLILILAAFRAMSGISQTSRNRHLLFWSYYSAIFITFVSLIVLDFLSSAFYLVEFFLMYYNSDNVVRTLEIDNEEYFKPFFAELSSNTRSLPSLLFFLISSKFVLLLTVNIAVIYSMFIAVWKVCRDNQKQVFKIHEISKKKAPSPVMSIRSIESMNEVPPLKFQTFSKSPMRRAAPEKPQSSPPLPPPRTNSVVSQTFSATLDIAIVPDNRSMSSTTTVEDMEFDDLRLPRVPNEKSSFQYPISYNDTLNRNTNF